MQKELHWEKEKIASPNSSRIHSSTRRPELRIAHRLVNLNIFRSRFSHFNGKFTEHKRPEVSQSNIWKVLATLLVLIESVSLLDEEY